MDLRTGTGPFWHSLKQNLKYTPPKLQFICYRYKSKTNLILSFQNPLGIVPQGTDATIGGPFVRSTKVGSWTGVVHKWGFRRSLWEFSRQTSSRPVHPFSCRFRNPSNRRRTLVGEDRLSSLVRSPTGRRYPRSWWGWRVFRVTVASFTRVELE